MKWCVLHGKGIGEVSLIWDSLNLVCAQWVPEKMGSNRLISSHCVRLVRSIRLMLMSCTPCISRLIELVQQVPLNLTFLLLFCTMHQRNLPIFFCIIVSSKDMFCLFVYYLWIVRECNSSFQDRLFCGCLGSYSPHCGNNLQFLLLYLFVWKKRKNDSNIVYY